MNWDHNPAVHIPPLQTLRALEAAGRLQSYSRAGEELGLTHGAVSRRLRDLAELTGKTLFERRGNDMVPTAEGTRLIEQVRNALGLLESIFPSSATATRRRLTISTFPALARWLVPRIASLRVLHPDLDLKLDVSPHAVELGHGIDAAVRYGAGSWPSSESRLLVRETLFPVCSPAYLAAHPLNQPADLLKCNLLRHPWHSWAAWFREAGVSSREPTDGPEYSDSSVLIEAGIAGEGVALARGLGVADSLRARSLVRPFAISIADERAYFFVRPQNQRDARLDGIENWLATQLREALGEDGILD